MMKKRKVMLVFVLLCLVGHIQAQKVEQDTIKTENLDEVVVVASRKPTRISEIPGTVWTIPQEKLHSLVATGVPIKELLGQLVPGMDVGSQARTNFGQNMRGRAMLVMIGGVSLNSLRGISRQLDAIDPFNIDRIEVLSGASSIYGGNATGGIINIITKTPKENKLSGATELGFRSGFTGTDDHDYKVAQSLTYKKDKLYGRFGVAYQKNGGVFDANDQQVFTDITQTDLQYNESIDLMLSGGYRFNDKHSISFVAQYYNSEFDGDKSLCFGENFGAVMTGNPKLLAMKNGFNSDNKIGTNRYLGILSYRANRVLGGQDIHLQVANRGEKFGFYPFPSILKFGKKKIPYTSSSEQNTNYTGVKLVLSKKWTNFTLTYGVDADFENFEAFRNIYDVKKALSSGGLNNETFKTTGRYPDIFSQSYAGYFQGKYEVTPKLTLNGGLRYQYMDVEADDFIGTIEQVSMAFGIGASADKIPGGNSSYGVTLGNIGVLFKPNTESQLWATFCQGAQLADPAKFYGVGSYDINMTNGNWDLKNSVNIKETSLEGIVTNQFELGYRINHNGFKGQIAGFLSNSNKNIGVKTNSKGQLYIFVEDLKLRNMGIEAESSYHLNNGFYLGVNVLFIKSEVEKDGDWARQSIFTASPSKLLAYIGYQKGKFSVRFQNQQTLDLKGNDDDKIKGYNTSDLLLSYNTKSYGKFSVGIQNLFNTDYQTIWSKRAEKLYGASLPLPGLFRYNGRGRTFNLSYSLSF